ncbi:MAG: hypothetical protein QXN34_05350 [Archaeoglobaceae archaeon]
MIEIVIAAILLMDVARYSKKIYEISGSGQRDMIKIRKIFICGSLIIRLLGSSYPWLMRRGKMRAKSIIRIWVLSALFLLWSIFPALAYDVNGCMEITQSGNYRLH